MRAPGIQAPITLRQDASAYVARMSGTRLEHRIADRRYAFLFVASGAPALGGERLEAGDAARIRGPLGIDVGGDEAETVQWDLPSA